MAGYVINRRRNYFIDSGFQTKFIVKFCAVLIGACLLAGILTYVLSRQTTTVAFENLKVVVKSTADFILPTIVIVLAVVTSLASLVTIAVTLFVSHRIAGPVYKLKTEFKKMKSGDFSSKIRIRSTDQLQDTAEEAENMRAGIRDAILSLRSDWDSIKGVLQKADAVIGEERDRKKFHESVKKIDSILAGFKTG